MKRIQKLKKKTIKRISLGRIEKPEDIADIDFF
jgi:hypothetical protein